jgi:hypothetical protein
MLGARSAVKLGLVCSNPQRLAHPPAPVAQKGASRHTARVLKRAGSPVAGFEGDCL